MGAILRRLEVSFLSVGSLSQNMLFHASNLLRDCCNLEWVKIQMLDNDRHVSKIVTSISPALVGQYQGTVNLWRCPELRELSLVGFSTQILPTVGVEFGTLNYGPYFINPLKRQIQALPKLCIATLNYAIFWTKTQGYSSRRRTTLM
ncbi:hypothetical protein BGZ93_010188 [Podila epicladia]|nr:hypothetical protein BGZ93_010188 [Podila epicladia]